MAKTLTRKTKQEGFRPRLARLRQTHGLTQDELATAVGLSNRMVAYYEREDALPPGQVLADLARPLKVTTDDLLAGTDQEWHQPQDGPLTEAST